MIFATTKEKILQYINFKGVTKTSFYNQTGIKRGFLDSDKLKSTVSDVFLTKIIETYPDLNLHWLINQEDDMISNNYKVDTNQPLSVNEEHIHYSKSSPNSKKELIPFYDVDFIAGGLDSFNDTTIAPSYYFDIPEFSGCKAFKSFNDSMEPMIKSGMTLFGKKINDWMEHLEYGQVYGIVCEDGRKYLKYIRKHKPDPETIFLLTSENSDMYDEFTIPKKAIKSVWLIHGWFTKRV